MILFQWLWNGMKWVAGLFLPFVGKARDFSVSQTFRWMMHFVLVGLVLAGLAYLNYIFDLAKYLEAPWLIVRRLWLPLLFLVLYLLAWQAWWLWRLLGPDHDPKDFPDIDRAWGEAQDALDAAGLNLKEIPLFLLIGRAPAGEAALFRAAALPLRVRQTPAGDAPIHVLASARSQVTGQPEPMAFVYDYGKGRVFHTPMGHSPHAMQCVGFITTLQRGAEWAATCKVTQTKLPDDFPTADAVKLRK